MMFILKPLVRLTTLLLAIFVTSRIALLIWQYPRLNDGDIGFIISGAIKIDLSSLGYLVSVGVLILILDVIFRNKTALFQRIFLLYGSLVTTVVVIIEASTPAFITQYDVRPNRLYVEYLDYPQEVFSMLVQGHLLAMLSTLFIAIITGVYSYRFLFNSLHKTQTYTLKKTTSLPLLIGALFLCLLAARGTLSHRPLNPALVYFSQDSLVNSLILNSTYSVAFAIKSMSNEKSASHLYGSMPRPQILDTVRQSSYRKRFVSDDIPTLSHNKPSMSGDKKNLVIILQESLGARFVGELGGLGITPEFDRLYQQGWGFDHLYATGIRSVRGIEAVTTGFIPSPSRSVVKLSKSQHGFYSLADTLAQEGYETQFIYGGESHFDNMKSFFLGNGFNNIVDINDFEHPEFISSWGVSDEDLFIKADHELSTLNQTSAPFFSLIFTSSNHDPFDIPEGKVSLPNELESDNYKRDLAIKYADYALGKFIDKAQTQAYWENTIFLVVADHDVRVFGSEPVPVKSFHIPAVILNSGIEAHRDKRLVSQIDLPVTLLSLLGIEKATPMLGFDLTKTYPVERAMMQYYDNFAYLENDEMVILMPNRKISYWQYNKQSKTQEKRELEHFDNALINKALAHVLFSNLAYTEKLYRSADKPKDEQ
jgi:phosphoglycerol transferase MdoB-like AlkP superfamily enzyme